MQRFYLRILVTLVSLSLGVNAAIAQSRGDRDALAASALGTYSMTSDTDILGATKTTFFSIGSDDRLVDWFSVRITWNPTYVTLGSYDETALLESTLGFTNKVVDQGSGYILLEYSIVHPVELYVGNSLLQFSWATPCQADGSTNTLTINPTQAGNAWSEVSYAGSYNPSSATNGAANVLTYTGDICPVAASGPIGSDIKIPLRISNNFHPLGGMTATVLFDGSKLDYVTFDTVGTYSGGMGDITITEASGSLSVVDNGASYSQTAETIWFYLVFTNTMTDTGQSTTVTVDEWEQVDDCSLAKAGETADASASVSTPKYVADIYYQDNVSVGVGNYKDVFMQLTNNFVVDMNEEESSTRAAFRPDGDTWQYLDTIVQPVGAGSYNWRRRQQLSVEVKIVEQDPTQSSTDIPPSVTRANIAKIKVKGKTAGIQSVSFKADDHLGGFYKEDSKLKSYSPPYYVLHTTTDGSDGLFRTHSNTITVTQGGGGGSCPFLMTWDGKRFVDENTILTQTEFSADGVPVVDYYRLGATPALVDDMYRLRIEERVDEVSYLDEIHLLRFDIRDGQELNVTPEGEAFLTKRLLPPVEAVDHHGADVLSYVQEKDGNYYVGTGPGWVTVTYEADQTESGRVYIAHAAGEKDDCPPGDPDGPGGGKIAPGGLLGKEEQRPGELSMAVRVGGEQWTELAKTPPRDYTASEYASSDIGLVAGERIEVRYSWTERWEADQLPLVLAADDVLMPRRLKPAVAFHSGAAKSNASVDVADNEFAVLARGEALDLRFPAGGRPGFGMKQVFVVAAKGYYLAAPATSDQVVPIEFALHPNYPNPFNAQTRIDFALPISSDVVIDVINVLGQRVITLIDGQLEAGKHAVVWNGVNEGGRQVASGTYFVRMQAGDFEQQRNMTLLK